jgi:hypothetical protein
MKTILFFLSLIIGSNTYSQAQHIFTGDLVYIAYQPNLNLADTLKITISKKSLLLTYNNRTTEGEKKVSRLVVTGENPVQYWISEDTKTALKGYLTNEFTARNFKPLALKNHLFGLDCSGYLSDLKLPDSANWKTRYTTEIWASDNLTVDSSFLNAYLINFNVYKNKIVICTNQWFYFSNAENGSASYTRLAAIYPRQVTDEELLFSVEYKIEPFSWQRHYDLFEKPSFEGVYDDLKRKGIIKQ